MAEQLSLDTIKDMKKAEYIKAFKNKNSWRKANAVIFLVDYKLEGKKAVIAIPIKKEPDMKLEMKRLKKDKLHLLKKSGGGTILFKKNALGEMEAKIDIKFGGLKPELLLLKATPLFEKIKVKLLVTQSGEAVADAAAAEGEVDTNENLPEDNLEDVAVEDGEGIESEDTSSKDLSEEQIKYKNAMNERLAKMQEQISKIKTQLKM